MVLGWSKTQYSPIAVDFGADSLKLLQIIAGNPPQLVAAASAVLPESARNAPAARNAFFAHSLKELLRSQPFKGRKAICSIPAYQTLVQHLQIPRTDESEFDIQVNMYLRQRLNVDSARMIIRYFKVGQILRDGSTKNEVICLAASREAVMRYIAIGQAAKLDVVGMHSEPLAILQAFEHLHTTGSNNAANLCFIDIGAATTKVIIAHGTQMVFAKTIHAAGDHFTRKLAQTMSIGFSQARQSRILDTAANRAKAPGGPMNHRATPASTANAASPSTGSTYTNIQPAQTTGTATEIAPESKQQVQLPATKRSPASMTDTDHESLDCLIDELQLCMRYYHSTFPDQTIEKLIFLGGESNHITTCQAIARVLRIGAQLGDPLARLVKVTQAKPATGVDLTHPQPGWSVPFGLCLSEANL